jgi:hypothetical protein
VDEHCAWQSNVLVNKLFVITTLASDKRQLKLAAGAVHPSAQADEWGIPQDLTEIRLAEPDVKPLGGTALLKSNNGDAAIVNRTGKGWTIYLNTAWDQYPKQRAINFGGAAYRRLVNAVLNKAGITAGIKVTSPDGRQLPQAQIARYKFGNAEILAIVKENVALAGVVGQDGVTTYNDASLGQVAKQDLTIKLPRKFYVADVRAGKKLGFTDVLHSSILVGDALVLALTPEVNELQFDGPVAAHSGEHVSFSLRSTTADTRLVRCHVYAPDGSRVPIYSNNVLVEKGSGKFILPFALNDPTGKYVVRATDVVTGAITEKSIELK